MMKFIVGFICGMIIATIGFTGVAHYTETGINAVAPYADKGVDFVKKEVK